MILNIIKGKSGTGKTKKMLEFADGNSDNLVITTEPSVYYIEKTLAEKSIPCVVCGHKTAAATILDMLGIPSGKEIKKETQSVIISKIMKEHAEEFLAFKNIGYADGTADQVLSFIIECMQQDIVASDINKIENVTAGTSYEKFHDIAIIYNAFEKELEKYVFATSEDISKAAIQAVRECKEFPCKNILIDSAEEYPLHYRELMKALAEKTENLTIAFRSTSPKAYDYEICKESMDTSVEVIDYAQRSGCTVNIEELKRKDNTSGISIIEKELFNRDTETISESDTVVLHEASSLYKEVDFIASQIKKLVAERKAAPEDIIVTSSTVNRYINIINSAFTKNGINFFYYKESRISKTYLFSFISAVMDVVQNGYSVKDILKLAQFSYLGIPKRDFSIMNSFFTRFGHVMDIAMKNGEKYDPDNYAVVSTIISRIKENISKLESKLASSITAKDIMTAIMNYLADEKVQEQTVDIYNGFIRESKMQEAEKIKASWNKLMEIFNSINEIFDNTPLTINDFCTIFNQMADRALISISQQFYGQVSIMDMRQAQSRKSKYLFVIGCNEGYFPENPSASFVDDHERSVINMELDTELGTSDNVDTKNRATIYSTLTMPSERLYISWSLNDIDSKQLRHATIIANVVKTFGNNIVKEKDYYDSDKEEAFINLLNDISYYKDTGEKKDDLDGRYMEFISDKNYSERLFEAIKNASIDMRHINSDKVTEVYNEMDFFAVTRIEKFGQCPFKHFVDYGLKPSRIKIFDETAADKGNYFHEVMKKFFDEVMKSGWNIKTITEDDFDEIINPIINKLAEEHNDNIFNSVSRFIYESEKIKMRARVSAWEAVKQIKEGTFKPTREEYAVGREIPLNIKLDNGKTAHIVGVIDRLDIFNGAEERYARIVDYKSGNVAFNEELLDGGVQLQLPLYSKAVSEDCANAGMYYFHIQDPVLDADNPKDSIEKRFQMSGPTLGEPEVIVASDRELADGSHSSTVISAETTKDGKISKRSKVVSREEYKEIMDKAVEKAKENISGIVAGETQAYPFVHKQTNACDYCKYRSICHFDPTEKDSQRHLDLN